mgnify:CR=1 FL=1
MSFLITSDTVNVDKKFSDTYFDYGGKINYETYDSKYIEIYKSALSDKRIGANRFRNKARNETSEIVYGLETINELIWVSKGAPQVLIL